MQYFFSTDFDIVHESNHDWLRDVVHGVELGVDRESAVARPGMLAQLMPWILKVKLYLL